MNGIFYILRYFCEKRKEKPDFCPFLLAFL